MGKVYLVIESNYLFNLEPNNSKDIFKKFYNNNNNKKRVFGYKAKKVV